MIETEALRKRFGKREALCGLDLRVAAGQVFGLIGPDGAGKTTTMRILAAVMLPTSGRATVLGHDTRREAEAVRTLAGYMPQRFSLYGDLSVIENLSFTAEIFGVRGRRRAAQIDRLLAFARLDEFRNRRAAALSGGMQKKLALACTLVHEPRVVLLDEPTTGVDPVSRREFWDILAGLHVQGVTICISTPYMDEAERCNQVGLLFEGRMIECDRPDRLRRHVPGELLAVRAGDLRAARQALDGAPGVLEVQPYGDTLHVFVADRVSSAPLLRALMEARGAGPVEIAAAEPRVEEAFVSLIRKRSEGQG